MKINFREFSQSFWSGPDPVLAEAGVAGELLVAKVRLSLATLLLLIPVINSLFFPVERKEGLVGISLASGTFFSFRGCLPVDLAQLRPFVAGFCQQHF
jgi:hypothetical protein